MEDPDETYSNEDRLLRHLRSLPIRGEWVLEVGAGTGRDSLPLAGEGARVVVLDYVESAFRIIRRNAERLGVTVYCVCADATRSPFREGTFQVVFHQGLMEHFRDPGPLLRENHRVTKAGGYCLVDVPQRFHPYTLLKHALIAVGRWFAGWETEYTPAELERLLERHGFTVVRTYGEWFVPGLAYRALRYAARRVGGVRLPLYPPEVPLLGPACRKIREALAGKRWALYTTAMIGVLGRKTGGA
jgi:SAM-dependent methyltransferase